MSLVLGTVLHWSSIYPIFFSFFFFLWGRGGRGSLSRLGWPEACCVSQTDAGHRSLTALPECWDERRVLHAWPPDSQSKEETWDTVGPSRWCAFCCFPSVPVQEELWEEQRPLPHDTRQPGTAAPQRSHGAAEHSKSIKWAAHSQRLFARSINNQYQVHSRNEASDRLYLRKGSLVLGLWT